MMLLQRGEDLERQVAPFDLREVVADCVGNGVTQVEADKLQHITDFATVAAHMDSKGDSLMSFKVSPVLMECPEFVINAVSY